MPDLSERLPELLRELSTTYSVPGRKFAVAPPAGVLETAYAVVKTLQLSPRATPKVSS